MSLLRLFGGRDAARDSQLSAVRARQAQAIADASSMARCLTRLGGGAEIVAANGAYRRLVEKLGHLPPYPAGLPDPPSLLAEAGPVLQRMARRLGPDSILAEDFLVGELHLRVTLMARPDDPVQLIWDIADIGDTTRMLTELAGQRDVLAAFFDHAPVGLYSVGLDGRFLFANQTFATWVGATPDQLTRGAVRLGDLLRHENGNTQIAPDWEGGEARLMPLDPASDQPPRLVGITHTPVPGSSVRGGEGGSERFSGVVHDLSRELRLRGTLRPVEGEFRRFFDQAPIGILVLDASGAILQANAAFSALCGREDWPGQRLAALVREEDGAELVRHLMAARRGEAGIAARPLEVRFSGQHGRAAEVFAGSAGHVMAGGSMPGSGDTQATQLVYLVDTTEQRSLQAQFNQSQKMQAVGQLAGGIAHDFNNLLTAMIGFCDLLLQRHQPGDQSFADVMQVKQNANRAANLVRQLLAFSRQQTLMPKVLDLGDVLADLRNLIGRLIGETISLRITHGRDLGLVKVDQGQIEQVIINLAVNARDAMNTANAASGVSGGELQIRTANHRQDRTALLEGAVGGETMPAGDYVLIEVSDTGHGIAPENLAKIFDPFFTTKAVGAGTGLGLSTVYGIIKQTGGFIQVESPCQPHGDAGENPGACFRIYLPRHQPSREEQRSNREDVPTNAADLTGQGLVLLVEDEDAVRAFAVRALRNKGYTVIEAGSGEQALDLPAEQLDRVDVLVTDVVMPNMDGPTLAEHLRQRRPGLKILFISGYAEDGLRRSLANTDNVSFLPKPFSLSQLAGKLKDVMEGRV
ncbi:response regulator [Ferrovibrio sp.]|uniref:response regulator n=1 Tax=Ferrovibrio sp. TaxID=1917215 RepID=UPI0035B30697